MMGDEMESVAGDAIVDADDSVDAGESIDGSETAAAGEGQDRGPEPQTDDLDLSQPLYELADGDDVRQLTGQEIIENFQAAGRVGDLEKQVQDLQAQIEAAQRGQQQFQPQAPPAGQEAPNQINELGNSIIGALKEAVETGDGDALGNLGSSLVDLIRGITQQSVLPEIQHSQAADKAFNDFVTEFPGFNTSLQDGSLKKFLDQNPVYTPGEAFLVQEVRNLKAQLEKAEKAGFQAGQTKTMKDMKARGVTLRGIGPAGKTPAPSKGPKVYRSQAERRAAMAQDPRLNDL